MWPFPSIAELQRFKDDVISQIWLDPWGVRFQFESGIAIYVEERLEQVDIDGSKWTYSCDAASGPPIILQRLLGIRIIAVEREDLCLTFRFENGASLSIYSVLGPYESGHIYMPDGLEVF